MKRLSRSIVLCMIACLAAGPVRAQQEHVDVHQRPISPEIQLDIQDNPAARVLTVRVGPLSLPGHTGHSAHVRPPNLFFKIPFDGWLIAYHRHLVDDVGTPLSGRLLHHADLFNTARRDFLCPQSSEYFHASGAERAAWPEVPGVGYPVARGHRILLRTMFHNSSRASYPKVYLELRVKYRLKVDEPPLKDVRVTWFSVKQCGTSAYDLKPGLSLTTAEYTIPRPGRLVAVGGHLHDYGHQLLLENLSRHQTIVKLLAKQDAEGRIVSIPVVFFNDDGGGYHLNRGEVVKVTATYDNPTGTLLRKGAMGIVVGYFLPDEELDPLKLDSR